MQILLKDVIKIKHGYAFKGEHFTNQPTSYIVVTPGNFTTKGGFQDTEKFYDTNDFPKEFILKDNDLIVTMTDLSKMADTIGFSALVPKNSKYKYLHNQRIGLVDVFNSDFDKNYIYWLMRSPHYQKTIANSSNGATVHHTSPDKIYRYKFEKINLTKQIKIADILSAYDDLIDNNNKRIKLLERMADNLYKEWFVRFRFPGYENAEFENGIPKGWEIVKVKDITKRLPFGKLYKEADVFSEGNIIVIDQSKNAYIGFHNNEPSHYASLENPIALFGDHSCKYQLMITPFSLSENVVPFVAKGNVLTTYLHYLTNGLVETTEYKRHWTELMNKKVLVAKIEIQKMFTNKVNGLLQLIEIYTLQNRNLTKQRDLLLPRLMSGKLEVE